MPKWAVFVLVSLSVVFGCGSDKPKYTEEELAQIPQPVREGLPAPSGGFVLAVGSETITAQEIVNPVLEMLSDHARTMDFDSFRVAARPAVERVIMDKAADIVLYEQAQRSIGDNDQVEEKLDQAVEAEIRKFIVGFEGDYAKAEAFLKEQMGMDWKDFRKYQRRIILSGSLLHQNMPEQQQPITYSDLVNYYESVKDEAFTTESTVTMRLIDIDTTKVQADDANTTGYEKALKLADELAERIGEGEDFALLAQQYSNGYRAKLGGLWKPVKPESLAAPYDVLAAATQQLSPGQIAGPIEAGQHIFIVKLEQRQVGDVKPLEEVQGQIEQMIRTKRNKEAFSEAIDKVVREMVPADIDAFVDYCLEEIYIQAHR